MSLDEYANQQLNALSFYDLPVIDSGYISLGGKDAFKVLRGSSSLDPTENLQIYSINGDKLYTISYLADQASYNTYLPGVQKIVDSFEMPIS